MASGCSAECQRIGDGFVNALRGGLPRAQVTEGIPLAGLELRDPGAAPHCTCIGMITIR